MNCLDDMARRWQPSETAKKLPLTSLFASLAERLREMHTDCVLDPAYIIDDTQSLCQTTSMRPVSTRRHWITPDMMNTYIERCRCELVTSTPLDLRHTTCASSDALSHDHTAATFMDTQTASQLNPTAAMTWDINSTMEPSEANLSDANLLAISESLMGPEFTDMDRVVTLDDVMLGGFPEMGMNWDFS